MKLTERDVTTIAFRFGAALSMMFMMALLALIGQELGVYGEMKSLVDTAILGVVVMIVAILWPIVSYILNCSRRLYNRRRGTATQKSG